MIQEEDKNDAFGFLKDLEATLEKTLPPADVMEPHIRTMNAAAKNDVRQKHLRWPESAFLNSFMLPALADAMRERQKLSDEELRDALLNECYRDTPSISRMTPARTVRHPFTKVMGASASSIYDGWKDEANGSALVQSCPDFAVRSPFVHKIVFEGKYFPSGSQKYANTQLVTNLYQAFFYRGLPFVNARPKPVRPEWDYDYGCLVAYDASPEGTLKKAWKDLPKRVRNGFWEGANIYVMILGGEGRPKQ